MHGFHRHATLDAAADIRLVCNDDQEKVGSLKSDASVDDIIVQLEIVQIGRWMWLSLADDRSIEYAISIQKNCSSPYFIVSHFVSARLRVGCEIHRCHTTAWKASVCGVTLARLTVGITTATSATCAV